MKKVLILITVFISLALLSCSSNTDKHDYYGKYTFEEVVYLSPLSSSTVDYLNERMAGTKYIIEADLYKIESADNTVEISSPNYVKEKVQNNSSPLFNVAILLDNEVKHQYTIYNEDGSKTHWRLYAFSDCLWVASYADNTADGSEIIMYIYKLSR